MAVLATTGSSAETDVMPFGEAMPLPTCGAKTIMAAALWMNKKLAAATMKEHHSIVETSMMTISSLRKYAAFVVEATVEEATLQ